VEPGSKVKLKDIDPGFKDHHDTRKESDNPMKVLRRFSDENAIKTLMALSAIKPESNTCLNNILRRFPE
jgi:hypothetical protein